MRRVPWLCGVGIAVLLSGCVDRRYVVTTDPPSAVVYRNYNQSLGLTPADAYSLASIGVDFRVAEAVDSTQVIYAAIPKKLFKSVPPYWATP